MRSFPSRTTLEELGDERSNGGIRLDPLLAVRARNVEIAKRSHRGPDPLLRFLLLDGVYTGTSSEPSPFAPLPPLETEDVAWVLAGTARRILRRLERLCRCVARPPLALDRLEELPERRLAYRLGTRSSSRPPSRGRFQAAGGASPAKA